MAFFYVPLHTSLEHQPVRDSRRGIALVMRHKDDTLSPTARESLDNSLYPCLVIIVEPVHWLVEYKQLGVLDKGTRKECQTLLAA